MLIIKFNIMNKIIVLFLLSLPGLVFAQKKKEKKEEGYKFEPVYEIKTTPVKDQNYTGTCWAFATTSFLETEALRLGKKELDLSEMFFVRHAYTKKVQLYVRYHGNYTFGEGGQAHDVLNVIRKHGIVPDEIYPGLEYGEDNHDHGELATMIEAMVNVVIKNKNGRLSTKWQQAIEATLDTYLGIPAKIFRYNDEETDPIKFQHNIAGIIPDDYVEITSYSHHPFYTQIDLEVPDNWSHDLYYNIPIDDLMKVMDNAFENGFSVCWDGDMSEKTFSHKKGVAVIPEKPYRKMTDDEKEEIWKKPGKEREISQELRQITFDNYTTNDDHLMHLVGLMKDQNGTKYYKTKNSWAADSNDFGGFLNMSESFIRLKTVAILVHKDAIPEDIKTKMGL
jgi:bleomycin hydrolase